MVLHDANSLFAILELRHVTLLIARLCQPLCALRYGFPSDARKVLLRLPLKYHQQQLLRCSRPIQTMRSLEQLDRDLVAGGREEIVGARGEPINEMRPADLLWFTPAVDEASFLQIETDSFDPHVTHLQPIREIGDAESLGALELVKDL